MVQPTSSDDDLRRFLAKPRRPRWLSSIIKRQVEKWQGRRPAKYFHLAPSWASGAEVANSVEINPRAALRFFRRKLTDEQVDRAISRDIESGVIFAFERFTENQIRIALRECPGTLLTYRADLLNYEHFEHCARFEPFIAFSIRDQVSDPRHAILLARSYSTALPIIDVQTLTTFHREIFQSLKNFPAAWLRAHKNDFRFLVKCLERDALMRIDDCLILSLLVGMPHEFQPLIVSYLSESI